MDSPSWSVFKIFLAFFFVLLNSFFVLSEFALVKVRRTRLDELSKKGSKTAKLALYMHTHLDSYLSTIQLGITLASLALGWLGEPAIARLVGPFLQNTFDLDPLYISTASFTISFAIITLLHVVLGELIPKSIAIQRTEPMVLMVAPPLYVFHKLGYPIVFIFDKLAALCLKLMGLRANTESELVHSPDELKLIVDVGQEHGVIDPTGGEIIKNAVSFSDKTAEEIVIPRQDMVCLYLDKSFEENMNTILENKHTRYPVCEKDKDNIVGMIHYHDLVESRIRDNKNGNGNDKAFDLRTVMREIIVVPETLQVVDVLKEMKKKRSQLAVVVDEYGGTAGMLSLEDLIEEIIGEISDEHDLPDTNRIKIDDSTYEFTGTISMEDVMQTFKMPDIECDDVTIGGHVFTLLGRPPKVGDKVLDGRFKYQVLRVKKLRITKVRVTLMPIKKESKED